MPLWLQKRRRRWYAVMEIPKALRVRFGRPRFVVSLETESLTVAERRVLPIVAKWKESIERAKLAKGGPLNLADEVADWRQYSDDYKKQGKSQEEIDDIMFSVASDMHDEGKPTDVYDVVTGDKLLLVEYVETFISTQTKNLQQKSIDMKKSDIMRFLKKFTYAQDATKRAVMLWVEEELRGRQILSEATCRRIVGNIHTYWAYLERFKELELPDPFIGVVPSKSRTRTKQEVRDTRKAWSVSDYQKLMRAAEADTELADLIRLGAYTGCRIEELCDLKMENVLTDRLKIEDAKTQAGWREVPIHPQIQKLVEKLGGGRKDGYFMSGLSFNKYGDRSNAIGKRFGRLKTKCDYGKDYVFHSFRHSVATQLENAQVPENHVARLIGHKIKTMSFGLYSGGLSIEVLREAILKLNWE